MTTPAELEAFSVTVGYGSGRTVVTVAGELDLGAAPKLRDCLLGLPVDTQAVDVDLGQVRFMDSTGIGVLLAAFKHYRLLGIPLQVSASSPVVARVLEIAGLRSLLGTGTVRRPVPHE